MKIHAHKESHMNINMSINKSTHRSRYKQSLTNRKINDQRQVSNCN